MKLNENTIAVLKNFSSINSNILFKAGKNVRTRTRTIIASADLDQEFPKDFAIMDLGRFLSVVNLFEAPELNFDEEDGAVHIGDGKNVVRYVYTAPNLIVAADYEKELKLGKIVAEFTIKQSALASALKAASILSVPNLTVRGEGGKVVMVAHDAKNTSSDSYAVDLGDCDEEFVATYQVDCFKFIPQDYNVQVSDKVISKFEGKTATYFIAAEVKV